MTLFDFKKFFFLITLTFFSSTLRGQTNWLWGAGSDGNDEALSNTIDLNGNIYTTGYFSLFARFENILLTSSGGGDVFILKQNAAGNILWAIKAGGNGSDRGTSVATDGAGNIYVCGYFSGTASFGSTQLVSSANTQDIFVAKLDAAGNFLWARKFGGNDVDLALALAVDKHYDVVITGQFKGNATFGSTLLSSTVNPANYLPSFDIFLLKVDSAGNFLWVKQGAAKYDDRGLAVATDDSCKIYLTGQFSDTLRFSNSYTNIGYNIGFLLKADSSGQDVWFKQFIASYVTANSIAVFGNDVYVTGDFLGQLNIQNAPPVIVNNPNPNKIFLLKVSSTGSVTWVKCEGSANALSSLDVATDGFGNPFIAGTFKCLFTDYSSLYDPAIFYSVGVRDIFLAKYSAAGSRMWQRHFAGPRDDYCSALSVDNTGTPVISGSYEKNFNVPRGNYFSFNTSNFDSSSFGPVQPFAYCASTNYNRFISVASNGFKDLFISKPYDKFRGVYDYFDRSGFVCDRDTLTPYINNNEDTLIGCDYVHLFATRRTGLDGLIGPEYFYSWSNGQTNDRTIAYSTGYYYLTIQRKDQCLNAVTDSVYVIIYPGPPAPVITNINGTMQSAIPIFNCLQKLVVIQPDTAWLVGSNFPAGYNYYWLTPNGNIYDDTIQVTWSGTYRFYVVSPYGNCNAAACIDVTIVAQGPGPHGNWCPPHPVPEIHFTDSAFDASDTVEVCYLEHFEMMLVDSARWANHLTSDSVYIVFATWQISGGFSFDYYVSYPTTVVTHHQLFLAQSSGNCSVTITVQHPLTGLPLGIATRNFYLIVNPLPPATAQWYGPSFFCPSDTVLLHLTPGYHYSVSGPELISASVDSDSVYVAMAGTYTASYTITDSITGCTNDATISFILETSPLPRIKMTPANGIICPNDSILLTADSGSNYVWYGPLGIPLGNTQSIYATGPGLYHYTFIDSGGCALVSEFVNLREYSTPSISFYPGNILCPGDSVILTISQWDTTGVQWLPPLSGNSLTQTVYSPGTYSSQIFACNIMSTVSVTVTSSTVTAQIAITGQTLICPGDTVILTGPAGMASYLWQPGNLTSPFIVVNEPGIYSLQVTDFNGCGASDTVAIDPISNPVPPAASDVTICEGQSVLLYASGSGISWYDAQNLTVPIFSGNAFQTPVLSISTTYYVTSSDSLCKSLYVPVNVFVQPAFINPVILSDDSIVCANTIITLSANMVSGATYSWAGPNNFQSIGNPVAVLIIDSTYTGYYYLVLSDNVCTSALDSIFISMNPSPLVSVTGNTPHCPGTPVMLSAYDTTLTGYQWLPGGESSSGITTGDTGVFTFIGTNIFGCTDTVVVDVTSSLMSDENIWLPNAFTPNSDGKNDIYEAVGNHPCEELTFYVFNRWGELIYELTASHITWNGFYDGKLIEQGVYVYMLKGKHTNRIGSITVMK